ncbi:MAG: molybdenum cofactor guanylyltransferase, partial [Verrucomicrobiota bacterium]
MTVRGGNLVGCLTESFGGRSLVLRFGFGMIVRGAVLAGGESQRMGRDKAFLRHPRGGRPLWERQVDVVAGLGVEEVFVSIGTGTEWEMVLEGARGDLRFLRDEADGKGPLEGIYRVMGARPDSWWVLLAVDLPAMRTETLQKRLHLAEEKGQAVIPWYRGYWEPVAGVWAPSIYPLVRKAREEG